MNEKNTTTGTHELTPEMRKILKADIMELLDQLNDYNLRMVSAFVNRIAEKTAI